MEKLLPDICTIQYGFPFDSSKFSTSEGMPLIRIRDVVRGYSETFTTEEYKEEYIVNKGDLLIGMDGEFNIARWGETPALLNQRVCRLLPTPEVEKNYLFYFMPSALKRIEEKTPFVTVKHLSARELNKVSVPLPPLKEQRRIAALLDKVSDLIAKRRAQLDKLDLLVKARFVEMFGDQRTNPKGWKTGRIRDVVNEVKYGTSRPAVEGGTYKYLRMGNITFDGHLDLNDLKYIDIPEPEIEKCIVRKGDVLFNRTNSKELVGKTCVFDLDEPMVIAGYIIRVRVNERVIPEYLSSVLNSQYGKQTLSDMCKAIVGQANINAQELQNIAILIPPIELQREFALFVDRVKRLVSNVTDVIEKLETLKKALMQQYFG